MSGLERSVLTPSPNPSLHKLQVPECEVHIGRPRHPCLTPPTQPRLGPTSTQQPGTKPPRCTGKLSRGLWPGPGRAVRLHDEEDRPRVGPHRAYEGGPQETEFIYKKLCIYSYTFKLQSPPKYPPFDAMHLLRHAFPLLKTVFELVDFDAL